MDAPFIFAGNLPYIPVEDARKLQAGISLFEIRWPKYLYFDKVIFGPFNVVVRESVDTIQNRPVYRYEWQTEHNASIKFNVINKDRTGKGIGVTFIPDDPYWHNRVTIIESPVFYRGLANMHRRNGEVISGELIKIELDCLRERLKKVSTVFRIYQIKDGTRRVISDRPTKAEAEIEIKGFRTAAGRITVSETGQIIAAPVQYAEYEIEETTLPNVYEYRPEIKQLIEMYDNKFQFGWTECSEFKEIRNYVLKEAEKRKKEKYSDNMPKAQILTPTDIIRTLEGMADEEKEKLVAVLLKKQDTEKTNDIRPISEPDKFKNLGKERALTNVNKNSG